MEKSTIALIVASVVSIILVIITIVLLAVYLSKGSEQKPTPRKFTAKEINTDRIREPPPREPKHQERNLKKIIKSPSTKRKVKLTPRDPSGKLDKLYVIDQDGTKHRMIPEISEPVLDIASYDEGLLVLLNYGNMMYLKKEDDKFIEYQLPGTIFILSIQAFNGEIIGLSQDGRLYGFVFFNEDNYEWKEILPTVHNAIYINSPDSQNLLYVQTSDQCMIFDTTLDLVHKQNCSSNIIRIYGEDETIYATVNKAELLAKLSDSEKTKKNVYDGAWHNGTFVPVSHDQYLQGIQRVKSIDNRLYYIINC